MLLNNAAVRAGHLGDLASADQCLSRAESVPAVLQQVPVLPATPGLLALRRGNLSAGTAGFREALERLGQNAAASYRSS